MSRWRPDGETAMHRHPVDHDPVATAWAYGILTALVLLFWAAVFVIPAAKYAVEKGTTRPAACVGLTAADCSARAEAGW